MLSRFDRIPERDGQTDGPTEMLLSISRVGVLTRDKKCDFRPISRFISETIQDKTWDANGRWNANRNRTQAFE